MTEAPVGAARGVAAAAGPDLPPSVCVRVTRACNARCPFCLAPPRGHGVSLDDIRRRLAWLAQAGVRKVNLSGGEPTIRNDLPAIVSAVRALGMTCAMTTNGIRLREDLLASLVAAQAKVKVSLHGPGELHDRMLGRTCFDRVETTIGRLLGAGTSTAVQTVVTRRRPDVHEWAIDYCLRRGIRKLRLLPFVPRGRGADCADEFQLRNEEHQELLATVAEARERLRGSLDVDVIDFWTQAYYVVETDGRLEIQRETDAADSTVVNGL
jgi:MoaA/NifB/PqqE/SkfB family radical SAM enzyme